MLVFAKRTRVLLVAGEGETRMVGGVLVCFGWVLGGMKIWLHFELVRPFVRPFSQFGERWKEVMDLTQL
jgi:hypothetical protein